MAHQIEASGIDTTGLVVLNTCTVTANADLDVRRAIRQAKRENPDARILVTGCYAERSPEELAGLEGVSWVVGNSGKTKLVEILTNSPAPYHAEVHVGDASSSYFGPAAGDQSRPNLKIQDGCNNRCSFCIIPSVRGKSRSADANWVVSETARLAAAGYPEVVLTGINLGRWGRERGEGRLLADLLRRMLAETPILVIRLSSIEPMDISDDLLQLMAGNSRIAKHVHAPLQSGSDAVLRRMYRKYRPRHYEDRLRMARELMPEAAIGADVMVGFPGETDEEFAESVAFVERMPFTYLHVFSYSERPGTAAMGMGAVVPEAVKKARNWVLREVGERKQREFRGKMAGKRFGAVSLNDGKSAVTTNFLKVKLAEPRMPREYFELLLS